MAVELLESGKTIVSVVEELGIRANLLEKWRRRYKKNGASSFINGSRKAFSEEEKEILRLKKEPRSIREERDILKRQPCRQAGLPQATVKVSIHKKESSVLFC